MQALKKVDKFEQRVYQVPFPKGFAASLARSGMQNGFKAILTKGSNTMLQVCESLINNTNLIQDLQIFELLVADVAFCGPILSDLLNIPRVELCPVPARVPASSRNIPAPPSYVPVFYTGNTDQMTFFQRVKNVLMYGLQMVLVELLFERKFNNLKMKYNIKPERNFWQAMADYEMILISTDFAIEYPHPLLPCKYINERSHCVSLSLRLSYALSSVLSLESNKNIFKKKRKWQCKTCHCLLTAGKLIYL